MTRARGPLLLAMLGLLCLAGAYPAAAAAPRGPGDTTGCRQRAHARRCANTASRARARSARLRGACPNAGLLPRPSNLRLIGTALLCLINHQRALGGLRPLHVSARLVSAAQRHSADMARADVFAHVGPAGDTLTDRIDAAGYPAPGRSPTAGENIAWMALRISSPGAIVAAWMASPEHRVNLLDPAYRDTGIGLVLAAPSRFTGGVRGATITEDFGARN